MPKILKFVTLLIFISFPLLSQQPEYVPGMVFVGLKYNWFKFPSEVYGAFISIQEDTSTLELDSLRLLAGSSLYVDGDVVSYDEYSTTNPEIVSKIQINFNGAFISELKKIDAYYIARRSRKFSPADTLPHYIYPRRGPKIIKGRNSNLSLVIEFNANIDPMKVAERFKKLNCVKYAVPNQIVIEF
jgi:hypothetical protein